LLVAHQRQRQLIGQQLVIGEPPARRGFRRQIGGVFGIVDRAHGRRPARPSVALEPCAILPFVQRGRARDRVANRAQQWPGRQPGGQPGDPADRLFYEFSSFH